MLRIQIGYKHYVSISKKYIASDAANTKRVAGGSHVFS